MIVIECNNRWNRFGFSNTSDVVVNDGRIVKSEIVDKIGLVSYFSIIDFQFQACFRVFDSIGFAFSWMTPIFASQGLKTFNVMLNFRGVPFRLKMAVDFDFRNM